MLKNLKNGKKAISTILIVAVLVVVIVAGGIAVYYWSSQNAADQSGSPSTTGTPAASAAPTATSSASTTNSPIPTSPSETAEPSAAPNVAGASSLQYSVSLTENGVLQGAYTYYGKNAGTNNFMMRIEYTDPDDDDAIYIFNGARQKAWVSSDGEWTDISEFYTAQYGTWNNLWQGYVNSLSSWAGLGDYTYSAGGSTVRIYDISVNPALSDSLFEHT